MQTAEDYLRLIGDWSDPNPDPVVEEHEGIFVVRDDLLGYGSKIRSLDYLIGHDVFSKHVREFVFGGCPATGYAQISLPHVCSRYDKRAVLFMAKRSKDKLHPYQRKALELGADIRWVPNGMLTVTKARAREYAAASSRERRLLPLGLEDPTVIACTIRVARTLDIQPDEVWSVGSSGTLSRSLQLAFPRARVHVVSVGHTMKPHEYGRATLHRSSLRFDQAVKPEDAPPFPSVPTYDAKAWKFVREHASPGSLFWNVGA